MAGVVSRPALLLVPALLLLGVMGAMLIVGLPGLHQAALVGLAALVTAASVALPFAGRSSRPRLRLKQLLLAVLVLSVPIIRWRGPGNTAIPDVALFAVVLIGLATLARRRSPLPPRALIYCWLAYIGVGLMAAIGSPDLERCLLTLTQDLFLLLFWIALHPLLYGADESIGIAGLIRIWLVVAAVNGLLVIVGPFGASETRDVLTYGGWGSRGIGLFRDPNMAAHYLGLSLMLLPLARLRMRGWRLLPVAFGAGCMLLGLAASGSNGAKFALAAAVATSILVVLLRRFGRSFSLRGLLVSVAAMVALLAVLLVGTWLLSPDAGRTALLDRAETTRVLRLGLITYTLEKRFVAWRDALSTFRDHPLGLGPGVLGRTSLSRADLEAHSDLLGALAERGPLGLAALLAAVAVWLRELARRARSARDGDGEADGDSAAAAAARYGATAFLLAFGLSLDTLHFRHLWFALALLLPPRRPREPAAAPASAAVPPDPDRAEPRELAD